MTAGIVAAGIAAFLSVAAASGARAEVRYERELGRDAAWVELRLFFGLWRRHWRIPEKGGQRHAAGLGRQAARNLAPGARHAWRAVRRGWHHLRGRVRVMELELRVRLGLGDPAATALAVGAAHAAVGTLLTIAEPILDLDLARRATVEIRPEYTAEPVLTVRGHCILTARLGHLMAAVAAAWWAARRGGGAAAWRTRAARRPARRARATGPIRSRA